jgi:F-type H+-transporting ATPase subunit a
MNALPACAPRLALATLALFAPGAALAGGGEHHFSWFQKVPGFSLEHPSAGQALGLADPANGFMIATAWGMVAVILGLALVARMGLSRAEAAGTDGLVPEAGLSVRTMFEVIIEWLHGLMTATIGSAKEASAFFPLVGTLFIYVLFSNLAGFIPGVLPVTEDMSSNFALGLVVFLVFNYAGLSRAGMGYIKHLAGPVAAIAPVFFLLEAFSLVVRPISLAFRLTVNITVDHLLAGIGRTLGNAGMDPQSLHSLADVGVGGLIGGSLVPVPLMFLGLLVCVVQAFVFALLTTIYIALSVEHHGDHGDHGEGHAHH